MDFKLDRYQHVLILLVILHSSTMEAAKNGLQPEGMQCACAGDTLIYNCSVVGGTATRWRGTALNCPMDDSEITLRHSQFSSNRESGICNSGDIVGRSIGVDNNNCYISQLNMTVRESYNNKTVQCAITSSAGTSTIGESLLRVASVTNLYPPENLYLADAQPGLLVFNWTPVISNCSTTFLQYIIASDCGACPTVTNLTTEPCSHLQLTTNAVLCHFRVSSRACDLTGNPSSPTAVTLKVPNVPQVEVIPSYSTDSHALERLFIVTTVNQTEDHFYISGNISGSPISYTAYGSNLVTGTSFNFTVLLTSCKEAGGCPIELPSSSCSQSTFISVMISAANKLGEGPRSNPFILECRNEFVEVLYEEDSTGPGSSISCVFLNQSDTSEKICCISYGSCDQKELGSEQICNRNSPYNIQLEVDDRSSQTYCYIVTASSDTYTIKVEGMLNIDDNRRGNNNRAAITAGVVVPIIFILVLLGTAGILGLVWGNKMKKKEQTSQTDLECIETTYLSGITNLKIYPENPLKPYLIPYSVPATSRLSIVDGDCDLRDFITGVSGSKSFRRGHTYHEFTNEVENILEGKGVLLQDKEKWFRLAPPEKVAAGRLKLYGEGIVRSSFGDQYRVFIQSFGSGARYVPRDSSILYNYSEDQVEPDTLPLVPVCLEHFAHKVIDSEGGLSAQQFCTQNGLNKAAFNIFLTVEHLPEGMRDQQTCDVILMDRVSRQLFTGPFARQMLDPRNGGESQHDSENEKWKVFVLLKKNKQGLILNKGSEVLYQDSNYQTGKYTVVDVDVDSVRLSKFIETKLNCHYEDGKAFYEGSPVEDKEETEEDAPEREEDLLYYKKILRPKKNELSCEELELQSLIEYFYAIPGVPSMAVKPDQLQLKHHRIFIQSTSQGSRCLKKGEKILYLKEWTGAMDNPDSQ